jgi:hypothetical protein
MKELLTSNLPMLIDLGITGLTFAFTALGAYLTKFARKKGLKEEAIEAISASVGKTYEDVVRHVKAASKDGKLDEADRKRARDLTYNGALEIAKGPVKKFLLNEGKDWIMDKVEDIISAKKKK